MPPQGIYKQATTTVSWAHPPRTPHPTTGDQNQQLAHPLGTWEQTPFPSVQSHWLNASDMAHRAGTTQNSTVPPPAGEKAMLWIGILIPGHRLSPTLQFQGKDDTGTQASTLSQEGLQGTRECFPERSGRDAGKPSSPPADTEIAILTHCLRHPYNRLLASQVHLGQVTHRRDAPGPKEDRKESGHLLRPRGEGIKLYYQL